MAHSFRIVLLTAAGLSVIAAATASCGDEAAPISSPTTDSGSGVDSSNPDPTDPQSDGSASAPDANPDSSPQGDGGGSTQEQAYCAAVASHGTCPGNSPAPCGPEGKCIYGHAMSPAGAAAYNTCYSSPSCKSDDQCANAGGQAAGGAAASTYTNDCLAKQGTCGGGGDYCAPAVYAYTGVGEAMTACLAKTCGELVACFKEALKPISDCKN